MRSEEQTNSCERYLFADEYFSDKTISVWQKECIERCKDKPKGSAYEKYINWIRQDNEIAVFTLYAYADFLIPKKFDVIFQTDHPDNYIHIEYELIQSIHEAWFPLDSLEHGHKHLCIFRFNNSIPDIFHLLRKGDEKFTSGSKGQTKLGFCNLIDFESIKSALKKK